MDLIENDIEAILKAQADIAGLTIFSAVKNKPLIRTFGNLLDELVCQIYAAGNAPAEVGVGNPGGDSVAVSAGHALETGVPVPDTPSGSVRNTSGDRLKLIRDWSVFTQTLIRQAGDVSVHSGLAFLTLNDDNPFTRQAEHADGGSALLRTMAKHDLARLGRLAAFDMPCLGLLIGSLLRRTGLEDSAAAIEEEARFIGTTVLEDQDWEKVFPGNAPWDQALGDLEKYIGTHGAGELGRYNSFFWERSQLKPVLHPDPIGLADLFGYEEQHSIVIANTLRFLEGKPANNLLLYGDRGTGKSAAVKAICNEYAHRGLRLLELRKGDLPDLSTILDTLSGRALRFIVFIDDLSFETTDDAFTSLKALLEGGVETRPDNVAVYATSNRRHLVKERMADRPTTAMAAEAISTGDARAFDTMQEQFSLADRFGVTVVFAAPNQEEYLRISCCLAEQQGLLGASEEARQRFREDAIRWERWFNGRSPRTAVQFVDWVAGGSAFPWEI
jgi:predicted AAA+ superfamily ATPase